MKFFLLYLGFKMTNIYITILKSLAPTMIAILKTEAKKSQTDIDDKLVNILEQILKEFKLL